MLSELLREVITGYEEKTKNNFAYDTFTEIITKNIPQRLSDIANDRGKYIFRGSVGQGNWAETPWLAILNPKVTTSTQTGYYVCYLIDPKKRTVYLSLAVGWTQFEQEYTPNIARSRIVKYSDYLHSQLTAFPVGFKIGKIDLSARHTLSKGYELGQILSKKYNVLDLDEEVLTTDLKNILDTYDELSLLAGNNITNIEYEKIESNERLNETEKAINQLTLSDDIAEIKAALADLVNDKPPPVRATIIKRVVRNPKIAKLYKKSKDYVCELCWREPFIQKNGQPYAEADHVRPLGWSGPDSPDNMRCLCAQCHAIITHGSDQEIQNLLATALQKQR